MILIIVLLLVIVYFCVVIENQKNLINSVICVRNTNLLLSEDIVYMFMQDNAVPHSVSEMIYCKRYFRGRKVIFLSISKEIFLDRKPTETNFCDLYSIKTLPTIIKKNNDGTFTKMEIERV